MEYDPASPTEEPEDLPISLDLSTIPLPGSSPITVSSANVIDIPLPPADFDALEIPLPPPVADEVQHPVTNIPQVAVQPMEPDQPEAEPPSGPLKFSLRISSKPFNSDASNEPGIFESSKDQKPDEPRLMPKLQAMMKRSKPSQLPVGVLPSKIKVPVTETKTELFLPSKEADISDSLLSATEAAKAAAAASGLTLPQPTVQFNHPASTMSDAGDLQQLLKDIVNNVQAPSSLPLDTISTRSDISIPSAVTASTLSYSVSVTPHIATSVGTAHIPNLMSLNVTPVTTISLQQNAASLLQDSAAMVRHSKLSLSNMQYVNPQKLRSAQMIATPLIANPAIAAQPHHNDDQSKSRDSRKRSRSRSARQSKRSRSSRSHSTRRSRSRRSRSTRRSRSPRRSRSRIRSRSGRRQSISRRDRRRRSSSCHDSPPRRGRYNRRSRSRRSPEDRHKRARDYSRTRERDRRSFDRRRTPREALNTRYGFRGDKTNLNFRHRSRSPSITRDRRIRRRSSSRSRVDRRNTARYAVVSGRDRSVTNNGRGRQSREDSHRHSRASNRKGSDSSRKPVSSKKLPSDETACKRALTPSAESDSSSSESSSSRDSSSKREDSRGDQEVRSSAKQPSASPKSEQSSSSSRESSECTGSSEWENSEVKRVDSGDPSEPVSPRQETKMHSASLSSKTSRVGSNDECVVIASDSTSIQHAVDSSDLVPNEEVETKVSCFVSEELNTHGDHRQFSLATGVLTQSDQDIPSDSISPGQTNENGETLDVVCSEVCLPNAEAVDLRTSSNFPRHQLENPDFDISIPPTLLNTSAQSTECIEVAAYASLPFTDTLVGEGVQSTDLPALNVGGVYNPTEFQQTTPVSRIELLVDPQLKHAVEGKYDLRERKSKGSMHFHGFEHFSFPLDLTHSWDPPLNAFDAFPDAPRPAYLHVVDNDYSQVDLTRSCTSPACLVGFSGSAAGRFHEMRCWVCDCTVPSLTDLNNGLYACGPGCINRALNIECGPSCPTGNLCSNRQFQLRLYAPSEPFYCGPDKGWGLRTTAEVKKHTFIIEYVGEVIDFSEFRRRVRRYERLHRAHHYFMALGSDRFIDAGSKGNWARFVNHSCEPNCVTQKWSVDGKIRIGFFALMDIPAGTELTIDYRFVQFGASEQKCYCGTPSCSGVMGSTSKALQDKVRLKDTAMVERRIMELLQRDAFHRASDITLLLQIMVQECLTRYTRLELLKRLAVTDSDACLKLFRQYNGLDMLAAFMCDSAEDDWELKRQILVCLDKIPVSEQKQVQTNSRLMDIVIQWTTDPRFCRPRGPTSDGLLLGQEFPVESIPSCTAKNETTAEDCELRVTADPCIPGKYENLTPYNHGDIPISEVTSPTLGLLESVSTSCSSTPNSTQSSVTSHVTTQSTSLAPPDASSFGALGSTAISTARSSIDPDEFDSPTVIADCDQNSPDISCRTPSELSAESDLIEEIRQLAANLVEKWSKLPKENYRIPRTERQETEKELHFDLISSSLVSWGHQDDQKNSFTSWSYSAEAKNSQVSRSKRTEVTSGSNAVTFTIETNTLSKSERRRLFEAQVKADEAKAEMTSSTIKPTEVAVNNNGVDELRQLISHCLLSELRKSESTTSGILSNTANTTILFNTLLQVIPLLLSKLSTSKDLSAVPSAPQPLDKASRKKMEKDFTVEVGNYILRLLRPYRLPNCLTGRIESHSDLVHIARKLTHAFVSKEIRHTRSSSPLILTGTLQDTIRSSLTRYMTSRGEVYKRRHKIAATPEQRSSCT
ncbi:unnamed protein product [Dicrocoelium dendriticum]|nr:unnamed protein product [Dicrocoelium dendriticum]